MKTTSFRKQVFAVTALTMASGAKCVMSFAAGTSETAYRYVATSRPTPDMTTRPMPTGVPPVPEPRRQMAPPSNSGNPTESGALPGSVKR